MDRAGENVVHLSVGAEMEAYGIKQQQQVNKYAAS